MERRWLFAIIAAIVVIIIFVNLFGFFYLMQDSSFDSQQKSAGVYESFSSYAGDDPVLPIKFERLGYISNGELIDNYIYVNRSNLLLKDAFRGVLISIPIEFNTWVRAVNLNLECGIMDPNDPNQIHILSGPLEDRNTEYLFMARRYSDWPSQSDIHFLGSIRFERAGEDVVLNTGFSRGTKIVGARKGGSANVWVSFHFGALDFDAHVRCKIGIVSDDPAYSIEVPLDIIYSYD